MNIGESIFSVVIIAMFLEFGGLCYHSDEQQAKKPSPRTYMVKYYEHMKPFKIHEPTYEKTFGVHSVDEDGISSKGNGNYGESADAILNYRQNHYLAKIQNLRDYTYSISNHSRKTQLFGDHRYNMRTIMFKQK